MGGRPLFFHNLLLPSQIHCSNVEEKGREMMLRFAFCFRGVYTMGDGARCTMAKIGGGEFCDDSDAFARVYNNLLLHEYIYYFAPVHF